MGESANFVSALTYQVPFCSPFWTPAINSNETLWSQLPSECRSANLAAACVACIVAFCCMLIHLATMVAYSKLRGDIFRRKGTSSVRKTEKRRKLDRTVIKEAANYAFAMTTQERLRTTLAFTGLFSSAVLLPVTVASTGIAYALPYPKSAMQSEETWRTMRPFSIAVTALYHLTLVASLCILLLMAIERCREIRKIHPDRYIKSGQDEHGEPYRRSMLDAERISTKNKRMNKRSDPDVIPRRDDVTFGGVQDTFLYTFKKSYTFLDLVMTLVVPLASGIITTVSVISFESRFQPYGIIKDAMQSHSYSINGLLSYGANAFPSNVYMYGFTIGVMIVACFIFNLISLFKCKTLISIAKYLPGFRHSRDLFKYGESKEGEFQKPTRSAQRVQLNAVRVVKVVRNPKILRQDPEGLSVNEPECFESSMSSIPPPPAQLSNMPAASLDNLSLPPPPRPESMAEPPGRLLITSPSLPSMNKAVQEELFQESYDDEIAEVKAEAFFGNIRQTKVVMVVFLVFFLLSAPSMVLFTMGAFYSHNGIVTRFMGVTNATLLRLPPAIAVRVPGSSDVITPTSTAVTTVGEYRQVTNNGLPETDSGVRKNWVITLSALFMVLYAIASMAPFFVYCAASRTFRLEASRFLCSCLPFRCQNCCKRCSENQRDISRTKTNRHIVNPSVRHSNSFRFTGNLGQRAPVKLVQVQKRRDRPGEGQGTRKMQWGNDDHYGTARL